MPTTRSKRRNLQVNENDNADRRGAPKKDPNVAASDARTENWTDFLTPERVNRKSETREHDDLNNAVTPAKRPTSGEKKLYTPGLIDAEDEQQEQPRQCLDTDFESAEREAYVPYYLYKNLQYKREGEESQLSSRARKAFNLIKEHYIVPQNFETSRFYGPWSGTCYEERLMAAYEVGLLQPEAEDIELCCFCGEVGHLRTNCSDLL